jgi:hypothetical protein
MMDEEWEIVEKDTYEIPQEEIDEEEEKANSILSQTLPIVCKEFTKPAKAICKKIVYSQMTLTNLAIITMRIAYIKDWRIQLICASINLGILLHKYSI